MGDSKKRRVLLLSLTRSGGSQEEKPLHTYAQGEGCIWKGCIKGIYDLIRRQRFPVNCGGQGEFPGGGSMWKREDARNRTFCFYLILDLPLSTKDESTLHEKVTDNRENCLFSCSNSAMGLEFLELLAPRTNLGGSSQIIYIALLIRRRWSITPEWRQNSSWHIF